MAENVLQPGESRIGWLVDGQQGSPEVAVMLQDTGDQVILTVPLKGMREKDQYFRWFGHRMKFGDDPDRTRFSYRPPRELLFVDGRGPVLLVGCRARAWSFASDAGIGEIVPNFVILGTRSLKYHALNGFRTEMPGLAQWTEMTSIEQRTETDVEGRVQRHEVILDSPPSIRLARQMNFTLYPTWRTSSPDEYGTLASHDIVQLETRTQRPRSWEDHLRPHLRLRELLIIAGWHPFGFSRLWGHRSDDPETALSGREVGERWSEVVTHRLRRHETWDTTPRFLFTLSDIGTTGVRRWLKLRSTYERAVQPLVTIGDERRGVLESQVLQSGIALEALGHLLRTEGGSSSKQTKYSTALNAVLADLVHIPLDDPDDWKVRSRECYMGLKHADREVPDSLVLLNTLRENLLILRLWVAGRLGMSRTALETRVKRDPHSSEYVLLD